MRSNVTALLHRLRRRAEHRRSGPRPTSVDPFAPVNVRVTACCRGWYFQHSPECCTPKVARPCSDCYADPGGEHLYPHCSWYDEPADDLESASWPDAARWPGHPLADEPATRP